MLEDTNNVLNSGDVPNIYKTDDWEDITNIGRPECQRKGLQPTDMNIMSQFIARIKKNIHIILAMSPIGEAFRSRLRMFPSLINCCTIDWFTDWPEEALISVAKGQLTEDDLSIDNSLEQLVQFFKTVHKSVEQTSTKFLNELRRHVYITPTSYLELLRCFKSLLVDKRNQLQTAKQRFSGGVERLIKAAKDVEIMKLELTEMKPQLAEAQIQSEQMMEKIVRDKAEAEETQKHVAKDEAEAQAKADVVESLTAQAQGELDEALPLLDKALESVKLLKRDHIVEVKSFLAPSDGVILTMEAVCIMMNIKPIKKNDPNKLGAKLDDYWEPAKVFSI
jgi:dynein heavy chain